MNKGYLILSLLVLGSFSLLAQINESDSAKIQLQLRIGGSYQTGNVELLRVVNQFDFSSKIFKPFVFKTQNNHFYQRIFGNKADQDISSRNYIYFNPQRKIYPYAIGFISTNFRRDIDLRTFMGLGATYQLMQKSGQTIKLSGNVLYEESTFSNQIFNYQEFNGSDQIKAFWSTLYLSGFHHFNNAAIKLYYELYWQQSLESKVNYRYQLLGGVDFKVVKGLAVQTRIIYAFENVTTASVTQEDLLWTWGLSYSFKSN